MEAEKPTPERKPAAPVRKSNLDEVWPVRSVGSWPEDLSLRREDIYDERLDPEPLRFLEGDRDGPESG